MLRDDELQAVASDKRVHGSFRPRVVGVLNTPVTIDKDHDVGDVHEQSAEFGLGFAQGLFGVPSLADVAGNAQHPDGALLAVAPERARHLDPANGTVLGPVLYFQHAFPTLSGLLLLDGQFPGQSGLGACIRVGRQEVFELQCHRFLQAIAE